MGLPISPEAEIEIDGRVHVVPQDVASEIIGLREEHAVDRETIAHLDGMVDRLRAVKNAAAEVSLMADLGVLVDAVADQNASEGRQFKNLRTALACAPPSVSPNGDSGPEHGKTE